MTSRWSAWPIVLLLTACAPAVQSLRPSTGPIPTTDQVVLPPPTPPARPSGSNATVAAVSTPQRSLPPEVAFRMGMMSLRSTGIPQFVALHPNYDGRGILIAILDSGIDPSVPGLQATSDSLPKLLDLRDFSGEGRIPLQPIVRRGDTLVVQGHQLLGAARVTALAEGGLLWGGLIRELPLGKAPAADLDGNGTVGDSLPLIVIRSGSGWALFADTQGDGTVANDRPVRDFAVAREFFGWSTTNRPPPVSLAVNFSDSAGVPLLDLFFDTSSHGTHVAGIAAGHDLYGVPGFDGVAPGARLIGLKIANDAHGGVTVSGSMVRAIAYAIRFARERQLRLVVNLSFGVGNEVEGRARIDARVDSILSANPDVVMTVAAGNDGPGLSTLGVPASSARVLAIGATEPVVFNRREAQADAVERVAPFSSRGGELAGPDFVTPGIAYSLVPNFAIGGEQESGTSMATPFAAGLAARLLSGGLALNRPIRAAAIGQALRHSARLPAGASILDAGAGLPDLETAWQWLASAVDRPQLDVEVGDLHARGAIFLTATSTAPGTPQLTSRVTVRASDRTESLLLHVRTTADWIHIPPSVTLINGRGEFAVTMSVAGMPPGVHTATVLLDERSVTIARVPVTLRIPLAATPRVVSQQVQVGRGGVARVIIPADSGRGMQVEVAASLEDDRITASLHEPGGMPFRDGAVLPVGRGDGAALFDIEAGDVEAGWYELDVNAGPLASAAATITVRRAPVRLEAMGSSDSLRIAARSVISVPVSLRLRAGLVGAERHVAVHQTDARPLRIAVAVPIWATRMQVDSRMPRDQWPRFTDFAVTFQDRSGRQLAASPLDYAFGRASPDLPARLAGDSIVILLTPAFAVVDSSAWHSELRVRFYAEAVLSLDQGGSAAQVLSPGKTLERRFRTGVWPIMLPEGFIPVIIVLAQEGEGTIWMREIALQGGTTP